MSEESAAQEQVQDHLRRLARSLRDRASAPVENDLRREYVEGFCDGMRLAADIAEMVADLLPVWPETAARKTVGGYPATGKHASELGTPPASVSVRLAKADHDGSAASES